MSVDAVHGPWVRRVRIENFRKFSAANWTLDPGINCLIGAGDGGKTTLMAAIEMVTWSSNALSVADSDFHKGNIDDDIVIEAWVVSPPKKLRTDAKFLGYLQGYKNGEILEDPSDSDDDPTVLQLQLRVDANLEIEWLVVKQGKQARPIGPNDRSSLAVTRIGKDLGKHLRWGRGSALSRLTPNTSNPMGIMLEATRNARDGASRKLTVSLAEVTEAIDEAVHKLRGLPSEIKLTAAPDMEGTSRGLGQVALHTGAAVPATRSGEGTQRLLAIAAQLSAISTPGVLILDEVEQGLEPHRVQHLISELRQHLKDGKISQVLLTTHSPRAIRELTANELSRVLEGPGDTPSITRFDAELQGTIRWSPEALLCPRVIVCEGATEVGIVRGLVNILQREPVSRFAVVEAADANGADNVAARAMALSEMGYEVAVIYDLDKIPKDIKDLPQGIEQFVPEAGSATENQIFRDISDLGVRTAVDRAKESKGLDDADIRAALRSRACATDDIDALETESSAVSTSVRTALAQAAGTGSWFKRIDYSEDLMQAVHPHILPDSHLDSTLQRLGDWMTGK